MGAEKSMRITNEELDNCSRLSTEHATLFLQIVYQKLTDRLLIKLIESCESLTVKGSEGYNRLDVKNKAWDNIARRTGKSVEDCKSRFLSLVEIYFTENAKSAGNNPTMVKEPRGLYHEIRHLQEHIERQNCKFMDCYTVNEDGKPTATKSELKPSGLDSLDEEDKEYCLTACDVFLKKMNIASASGLPKEFNAQTIAVDENFCDNAQNMRENKRKTKIESKQTNSENINEIRDKWTADDHFGRFVAAELKEITDSVEKRRIKSQIASVLLDDDRDDSY